jgi:long-chain acyl-CoA synthetase
MMVFPPNVSRVFDVELEHDPNRLAVTTRSGATTYAELDARANQCARALREWGVRPGERVSACLPNDIDILIAFHGVMRLGAIWVGINQALSPPEKAYMLSDSGTCLLLCDEATASQVEAHRSSLAELRDIVPLGTAGTGGSAGRWRASLEAESGARFESAIDPHAPAAIAYTSGTTGYPKGAVHSQHNLLAPGAYLVATRKYDDRLRKGDCFPLTIINMMVLTTLLTAQARGAAIIMDSLKARDVSDWIRRERVTVWNGPPPVLYTMAHDDGIQASDLGTLQEVWSGGADCPEPIRSAFESKFRVQIRGTYGQTEAPTVITIEVPGVVHAPGSSGIPLPHLEVTIRDPDGRVLPSGEVGEICVGSRDRAGVWKRLTEDWNVDGETWPDPPRYQPMLGYWNRPEESAAVLRGDVLHTGDAGAMDEDNNLIVSERLNLVLNRGGANVYPAEIERVALEFAAVDACGVLGVPDARLGQRVGMLVQFKPGYDGDIEGLMDHCRAELAQYKVPEFVAAVDSLPRNAMGKIDRRALSEVGRGVLARP